jgi:type VII secretion integral membrane protein EccD
LDAVLSTDLCRVTVISPNARIDVALPADLPLADLLPALVRAAGAGLADRGGWSLQRLGEAPLDLAATPASLSVRDGEILHLRPAQESLPELAFDDVADAIATGRNEGTRHWSPADGRRAGLAAALLALAVAAVGVTRAGPPWGLPSIAAAGIAVALLVTAAVLSRAVGDAASGAVLACAGIGFSALAGALAAADPVPPTSFGAACLLGACAAALVASTLAAAAVGDAFPLLTGIGVAAAIGVIGSALDLLTPWDGGRTAAVVAAATLTLTLLVPSTAMRLADLPQPAIPLTADDVRNDDSVVAGADVIRRTLLADRYITALIGAAAAVLATGAVVLSTREGGSEPWLVAVLAVVTGLRARVFGGRRQRAWLFAATAVAGVALVETVARHQDATGLVFAVAVPLLVLTALLVTAALRLPGRAVSPVTARIVDVLDAVLVAAVLPLVLAVLGVYGRVRGLAG